MKKKTNIPTKAERFWWERVRELGCVLRFLGHGKECSGYTQVHHIGTGIGRRKDHKRVIPLCLNHHQGDYGFDCIGKRVWQEKYAPEDVLLTIVKEKLDAAAN